MHYLTTDSLIYQHQIQITVYASRSTVYQGYLILVALVLAYIRVEAPQCVSTLFILPSSFFLRVSVEESALFVAVFRTVAISRTKITQRDGSALRCHPW